jgi:hypothetical protein
VTPKNRDVRSLEIGRQRRRASHDACVRSIREVRHDEVSSHPGGETPIGHSLDDMQGRRSEPVTSQVAALPDPRQPCQGLDQGTSIDSATCVARGIGADQKSRVIHGMLAAPYRCFGRAKASEMRRRYPERPGNTSGSVRNPHTERVVMGHCGMATRSTYQEDPAVRVTGEGGDLRDTT